MLVALPEDFFLMYIQTKLLLLEIRLMLVLFTAMKNLTDPFYKFANIQFNDLINTYHVVSALAWSTALTNH